MPLRSETVSKVSPTALRKSLITLKSKVETESVKCILIVKKRCILYLQEKYSCIAKLTMGDEDNSLISIPQAILDRLTRVDMPKVSSVAKSEEMIEVAGVSIPVYECETLVLGSGAAGMRAAVELKRRGVDVLVASTGLFAGTSACSGSDKQTLYTASTDYKGDNFVSYAKGLCSGGDRVYRSCRICRCTGRVVVYGTSPTPR